LIRVLNRELRPVGVRSDLEPEVVIKLDIREYIQARELVVGDREELAEAVVGQAQLIRHIRAERMIVCDRGQPEALRKRGPECGKVRGVIQRIALVEDKPATNLV